MNQLVGKVAVITGGGGVSAERRAVDLLRKVQRWQYWTRISQLPRPLQMS